MSPRSESGPGDWPWSSRTPMADIKEARGGGQNAKTLGFLGSLESWNPRRAVLLSGRKGRQHLQGYPPSSVYREAGRKHKEHRRARDEPTNMP